MQFLANGYGLNHYRYDRTLRDVLAYVGLDLARYEAQLTRFGHLAGHEAYEIADYTDKAGRPRLQLYDVNGNRVDYVRLNPAHRELLDQMAREGFNSLVYDGGPWALHFALQYLVADPGLLCVHTITNQTAYVIAKYAPDLGSYLAPLLGKGAEVWYGATWLTEIQGGSDIGANTTRANLGADGTWRLYGEKYFASGAGLADLAVVSARLEGARAGAKGLSMFLVPRRDREGRLNYRVRRLKEKSATQGVPSGEVEFHGAEAYLVGDPEQGIYYLTEMLMVSRLANAAAACGIARKGYIEAFEYARRRRAFGRPILDHLLVRRDLLTAEAELAGALALTFRAVRLWEKVWQETPPYSPAYHHCRLLTHLAKNLTAEVAAGVTRMAMELHGGIGFLQEFAVERWHREALITPIWEGTSNIQALDLLEVMGRKQAHQPFLAEMTTMLEQASGGAAGEAAGEAATLAREALQQVQAQMAAAGPAELEWHGKAVLNRLADIARVALLLDMARSLSEPRYARLAGYLARLRFAGGDLPPEAAADAEAYTVCPGPG